MQALNISKTNAPSAVLSTFAKAYIALKYPPPTESAGILSLLRSEIQICAGGYIFWIDIFMTLITWPTSKKGSQQCLNHGQDLPICRAKVSLSSLSFKNSKYVEAAMRAKLLLYLVSSTPACF